MVKIPKVRTPYSSKEHRAFPTNEEVVKMSSHRGVVLECEEDDGEKYVLRTNNTILADGGRYVGNLPGGTDVEDFVARIFEQRKVVHFLNHHYRSALMMKDRPC